MDFEHYATMTEGEYLELDLANYQSDIMNENSKKHEIKEDSGLTPEKKAELLKPIEKEIKRLFKKWDAVYKQLKNYYPETYGEPDDDEGSSVKNTSSGDEDEDDDDAVSQGEDSVSP